MNIVTNLWKLAWALRSVKDPEKTHYMRKLAKDSDWEEGKHPRDKDGRFTSVGGVASAKKEERHKKQKRPKYTKEEGYKSQIGDPLEGDYHGYAAIQALVKEKHGYVPNAFTRPDIGNIALPWGDDFMGLKHIIQERMSQGISLEDFLPKLSGIIEDGKLESRNGRFYIRKNHYTAIVSPTYFDDEFAFLLTGWDENYPESMKKH